MNDRTPIDGRAVQPITLTEPNAETIEAMREARAAGLQSSDSIDELMAELNADDPADDI